MLVSVFAPSGALALGDISSTATDCSIAAGRDATNNTITCNYGLAPEQVQELTKAAVSGAVGPLETMIVDLSKRLGVTEDATRTMLRIIGEQNVPLELLSQKLIEVANQYQKLQAQAAALNPDNPQARGFVEQAQAAIKAGNFREAHQLLSESRQAQIAAAQRARKLREQARGAEDAELIGAAAATAAEGDLAMTELQYERAADLFKQAAALVPPGHLLERARYLSRQADSFYREGDERGDNAALKQSIRTWHLVLQEGHPNRHSFPWAMIQNNLGNVLSRLGEREVETARLEEAVATYRAALEEFRRNRAPLQWAMIQNNLGTALLALGEREAGTARLEEAVAVYRAALEEYRRDRAPLQWALAQMNLGHALFRLGERVTGTAWLEEAVTAYRVALEERTRDRVPLDWAASTGGEGIALMLLAERLDDGIKAQSAVQQIEAALVTMRDGGDAHAAAYYEVQLPKARALFDRLTNGVAGFR